LQTPLKQLKKFKIEGKNLRKIVGMNQFKTVANTFEATKKI
jgi:hypothetical protein